MMLFLKSWWKEIIIAIILGALCYLAYDYGSLKSELALQEQKYETVIAENKKLNTSLDDLKELSVSQQKRIDVANGDRVKVVEKMTNTINILANQKPPKDCADAINWAIEKKGEMEWPK